MKTHKPELEISDLILSEAMFPRHFSNCEKRPFGVMFHNPEIPDSYDGNHAVVLDLSDVKRAVAEIDSFYQQQRLSPRIDHIGKPGEGDALLQALIDVGFQHHTNMSRYMALGDVSGGTIDHELIVRRVIIPTPELHEMIVRSSTPRQAKVTDRLIENPECHVLVGFWDDKPVTMAVLQPGTDRIARVDEVLTDIEYRGRGFARTLMHHFVEYHTLHFDNTLTLYTDNPTAERIYREVGFVDLDLPLEFFAAWRE